MESSSSSCDLSFPVAGFFAREVACDLRISKCEASVTSHTVSATARIRQTDSRSSLKCILVHHDLPEYSGCLLYLESHCALGDATYWYQRDHLCAIHSHAEASSIKTYLHEVADIGEELW